MFRTYQPKFLKRKRKIGFLALSSTRNGRKVLKRKRQINRLRLTRV